MYSKASTFVFVLSAAFDSLFHSWHVLYLIQR